MLRDRLRVNGTLPKYRGRRGCRDIPALQDGQTCFAEAMGDESQDRDGSAEGWQSA
jgi:hypothetical protein